MKPAWFNPTTRTVVGMWCRAHCCSKSLHLNHFVSTTDNKRLQNHCLSAIIRSCMSTLRHTAPSVGGPLGQLGRKCPVLRSNWLLWHPATACDIMQHHPAWALLVLSKAARGRRWGGLKLCLTVAFKEIVEPLHWLAASSGGKKNCNFLAWFSMFGTRPRFCQKIGTWVSQLGNDGILSSGSDSLSGSLSEVHLLLAGVRHISPGIGMFAVAMMLPDTVLSHLSRDSEAVRRIGDDCMVLSLLT